LNTILPPRTPPPQPTNHLDAESVAWLERFLGEFKGTVVAVTHDRWGRPAAQVDHICCRQRQALKRDFDQACGMPDAG
jgi:hypothetical protein